jgi:aminoglycoside phosphotransferase (APT) family kinase protein
MRHAVPGAQPIEKRAEKIQGGQSNPTYILMPVMRATCLRRKPGGVLLKSAHAVEREYRVQAALAGTDVPVARMLALCEDVSVIGSAFYVMEHVEGRAFDDPRLPDVPRVRKTELISRSMAGVLAAIHKIDIDAVGLSDYGPRRQLLSPADRPLVGPVSRQRDRRPPGHGPADRALDRDCPADDGQVTLVHGDFRIDNLLFAPEGPGGARGARLGIVDAGPSLCRSRRRHHAVADAAGSPTGAAWPGWTARTRG